MSEPIILKVGKRYKFHIKQGSLGIMDGGIFIAVWDKDNLDYIAQYGESFIECTIVDISSIKEYELFNKRHRYLVICVSDVEYLNG